MEENVIQLNGEIMISIDLSVKNVMYVKNTIFGILLYLIVKMENILQVLWMIQKLCGKIVETDAKAKSMLNKF